MSDSTNLVTPVAKKRLPPAAGRGRKKGSVNKYNLDLKNMILKALSKSGGVKYLQEQADKNPAAFMTLLGKTMPKEVTGADGVPLIPTRVIIQLVGPDLPDDAEQ